MQAYRVWAMQSAIGANAWRTAHNPPSPALLDATDRMGMLVS
jgi:beta-galactosidase